MCAEVREGNSTEELEMELEALDITDDPIDLDTADETESEELAKKLLDEQGWTCFLNETLINAPPKPPEGTEGEVQDLSSSPTFCI